MTVILYSNRLQLRSHADFNSMFKKIAIEIPDFNTMFKKIAIEVPH